MGAMEYGGVIGCIAVCGLCVRHRDRQDNNDQVNHRHTYIFVKCIYNIVQYLRVQIAVEALCAQERSSYMHEICMAYVEHMGGTYISICTHISG